MLRRPTLLPRDFLGTFQIRRILMGVYLVTVPLFIYKYIYKCFFGPSTLFSLPAAGLSSCSRLRGTQGAGPDPASKFGPWPRSVARTLGVQCRKSARGRIPSTWSLPGLCKPTYRLKECPTSHVIFGIWNVINFVRQ